MDWEDLKFSVEHLWIRLEDDNRATIGVSEEAFPDGEEITKIRLVSEGEDVAKEETIGRLTTSKPSVFRIYAPVSGLVAEVNEDILDEPAMILEDPYEEGWLVRIDISNLAELDELMTRDEYEAFIGGQEVDEDDEELDEEDYDEDDEDDEDEDDY